VLIAAKDNLKGFTDAIRSVFLKAITQLCDVHQIRNSMKYIVWKDKKQFVTDLKSVYGAIKRQAAESALSEFEDNGEQNTE
jgi:transposase-like protein